MRSYDQWLTTPPDDSWRDQRTLVAATPESLEAALKRAEQLARRTQERRNA